MTRKKLSRNAPCPCGSGKKYKHCCYGKGVEDDLGLSSGRQQPQYPIGTVALYGPTTRRPRRSPLASSCMTVPSRS
jgi:hypothetical protein